MGKMDISYILDPRHEKLFTIVSMLQLDFDPTHIIRGKTYFEVTCLKISDFLMVGSTVKAFDNSVVS